MSDDTQDPAIDLLIWIGVRVAVPVAMGMAVLVIGYIAGWWV